MGCSFPTSDIGFFPSVLGCLEGQLEEVKNFSFEDETKQQAAAAAATALFTAVIGVAGAAAADAAIHVVCLVLKSPVVVFKATLGALTGLDEYIPASFDGKDWAEHARKIYGCVVLFVNAFLVGAYDPEGVLTIGRRFDMMSKTPTLDKERETVTAVERT